MAYLGTETLSPQARLSDSIRPYFRIDGVRIAMDYADLADESVLEPLDIDEYGAPASGPVWTGSSAWVAEYRGITSDTCDQWTVNSGYYKRGVSGSTDDWRLNPAGRQEAGRWEGFGYTRCDQKNRLYCIEQPLLACGDLSCDADESAQNCPSDCAADPADTVCLTGKGITIGIIDTGVDYSHPDLGGSESVAAIASDFVMPPFPRFNAKVIGGYDFLNQDPDPMDDHGHGTHVASIAAGRGTLDGVAPEAQIVAYKVLGASGSGSSEAVIAAIERAMDPNLDGDFSDHLDVINLSLGTECWKYSPDCGPDDPLSTAIDTAVANGVVAVVSAGNRGPGRGTIGSPATARDAITVGAVTKVDQPVSFSAHGPVEWTAADGTFHSLQKPDIVAPGVMICAAEHADAWAASRCIDDRHIMLSGTSMAAPHAAGAAALLLQKHPDWTPQDIKTALRVSAKDLGAQTYVQGYGRLDALAALRVPTRPPIGRLSTIGPATGMIDIYGTATGTDFARFSLYYTAYSPDGAPSPLRLIATGGSAVTDGVLSSQFDTRRLDSGEYELRLVVESTDGSTAQDRSLIMVQNLEITAIGTHVNHLRADEPVFGVVSPGGYTDLRVEYLPKGADATGVWSTACVAQQPMEENTVCVIDTATLPNGNYSFRLAATLEGEPVHGNAFDAVVFKELLAGWPQEFDGFAGGLPALGRENGGAKLALPYWIGCENGTQGSQPNGTGLAQGVLWTQGLSFDANRPAPPFVDQNGVPDMPCEPSGALHIFDAFGAMTDVKALSDTAGSYGVPRDMAPVVLQSEGQSDALVLMKTSFDTNYQRAGVSDFTGRLQHRWDLENGTNGFFSTVRDGEVFSIGIATPTDDYLLNAFHADGNSLQGFPVSIASDPHQFRFIYPQAVGVNAPDRKRVAVLVGTAQYGDERLHDLEVFLDLYDLNGDRASHTLLVDGGDAYLDPYSASVLTADVRDDAQEEIAVGLFMYDQDQINANAFEPDGYRTEFFVLDANGTLLSRPRTETGRAFTRMIAADVGREKQVLAAAFSDTLSNYNSRLIAFDGYGDNVFHALVESAKDTALRVLGLVSADVDADGDPEFILSYEPVYSEFHGPSGIVIYDTNGERKEEFTIPATGYADHLTDPIVTDFDDDGLTDVVIVSTHVATNEQGKTRVYAFSLGTPYRFRVTDWPMYLHDAQHSACARCGALFAQSQSIETGVRRAGDGRINNVVIRDVPQESETIPFKQ
jgi:subtilisin family serine protease